MSTYRLHFERQQNREAKTEVATMVQLVQGADIHRWGAWERYHLPRNSI